MKREERGIWRIELEGVAGSLEEEEGKWRKREEAERGREEEKRKRTITEGEKKDLEERIKSLHPHADRLKVTNLSQSTNAQTLGHLFETVGVVKEVVIIASRINPRLSSGRGYVTMTDYQTAKKAQAGLNGQLLEGCAITVEFADMGEKEKQSHSEYEEQEEEEEDSYEDLFS